ncbi:MAG: hypothetical protein NTW53_10665 [Burkholderiales bacterium]|nr:hypothetical protein [Burkholderiales bacterium]
MGVIGGGQQNGTQAQECNGQDKSRHLFDNQLHQSPSSKSSREKIIFTVIVCQSGVAIHFSTISNRRKQHQIAGDDLVALRRRRTKLHAKRGQDAIVLVVAGHGFERKTAHEISVLRAHAVDKRLAIVCTECGEGLSASGMRLGVEPIELSAQDRQGIGAMSQKIGRHTDLGRTRHSAICAGRHDQIEDPFKGREPNQPKSTAQWPVLKKIDG